MTSLLRYYMVYRINLLPVINTINVFVLLNRPLLWNIRHANLLSLVYKRRAGLESMKHGNHFCTGLAVLRVIVCETADDSWLVVVFQVEGVPAVVVVHEFLPFGDNRL